MSGSVWMFSDQIDDEDMDFMRHEFVTYSMASDYYGLGLKPVTRMAHEGFQSALIPYFQQGVAQLVQLVDVLTFVEIIVEPQHITVKAGKEHFAVPFPVYPDFGKGGLQLLCRHGEMYRCPYLNPH